MRAFLGIGGNLGDRRANMRDAVSRIRSVLRVVSVSSLYETAPVGFRNQPAFLNAVVEVNAPEDPHELHRLIMDIESDLGRKRTFSNAPRTIDLDILLHGDLVISGPALEIPHPRMNDRAFVMVPLAEIAPDTVHPVHGRPVSELAADLGDTSQAVWIVEPPGWDDSERPDEHLSSGR